MPFRFVKEELNILISHLDREHPDPDFILLHAETMLHEARLAVENLRKGSAGHDLSGLRAKGRPAVLPFAKADA